MTFNVTPVGDNAFAPGMTAVQYNPDQLIAGDLKIVTGTITIASGAGVLKRGTVIGLVTASTKYIVSVKTAADGSQVPLAILVDDTDATSADATAGIYQMGEFNGAALTYDASWSLAALAAALRPQGIFVKSSVTAADPS